jgi:hypothetical protein
MVVHLIGRIAYHLQFSNDNGGESTSTAGESPRQGHETPKAGSKRARSKSPKQGEDENGPKQGEDENGGSPKMTGFIFIPDWEEDSLTDGNVIAKEYQIVAHQSVLQSMIDAVRFRLKVIVTKYCIIDDDIMELHNGGLILSESDIQSSNQTSTIEYLSLQEFQTIEMLQRSNDSKEKSTNKIINIFGTVDSISPIIGAVPSDPFALMEIYDETNDWTLTAVVVLKGADALLCQAGMQPGLKIKLKNVKRQKWHVPVSFQRKGIPRRLFNRAPSHVFVVSEATSIEWDSPKLGKGHDDVLTLPSTVETLTSIQGRVVSVQYTDISDKHSGMSKTKCKTIHYVTLRPLGAQIATTMKLYLTYYPLSPMLISGIRKGCIIRAVNIHSIQSKVFFELMKNQKLDYKCYATCLRSTVSILSTSSECTADDEHVKSSGLCARLHFVPFHFFNVRQSYFEIEWISLCRKQFAAYSTGDKVIERTLRKLIRHDRERKVRDPYQEWFDHVCEEADGDDYGSMICPCENRLLGISQEETPFVMGLQKFYQQTMDLMISKLSDNLHAFSDKDFGVGCTASYHIQTGDLSRVFGLEDDTTPFIGGFIRRVDSKKGHILSACDKSCEMTFTPLLFRIYKSSDTKDSLKCHQDGDFVLIKPHVVVMSCLYLGSQKSQIQTINVSSKCVRLPPLCASDETCMFGPCFVVEIGYHLFLVSIQVLYDIENVISATQQRSGMVCKQNSSSHNHRLDHEQKCIQGRLLRQRWTLGKGNNDYVGCQLAVSLADSNADGKVVHLPVTLSVRLKIPTPPQQNEKWNDIQTAYGISSKVIKMAMAWQYIAESSHAPLTLGGWDEFYDCKPSIQITEVNVLLPLDAAKTSLIWIESFDIEVVHHKCSKETCRYFSVDSHDKTTLTYMGGQYNYPGMLPRRLRRSLLHDKGSRKIYGEALVPHSMIAGPHETSLGLLYHMKMFGGNFEQYTKKPVKIRNANISKIRFCRARAECSRCHSPLTRKKSITDRSFWNNPLPIPNHRYSVTRYVQQRDLERRLACPNGCDCKYAYIKWELSAILEDSTGSAKIYSERETALLILGKGLDVGVVEDGAWHSEDGIYFRIGFPLSREVKLQVERHISSSSKAFHKSSNGTKMIPRDFQAIYELYRHCTLSSSSYRKMDFLCSYKMPKPSAKIADTTEITLLSSLGQGQGIIQTFDTSTTLPGIELSLIDCFQVGVSQAELGWEMIEALKKY